MNQNCRKVVQYVNYTDSFDDSEGHGTHGINHPNLTYSPLKFSWGDDIAVSTTAAGLAWQNYGDYKKYNGNAVGAKIAFFDIGNVNSSKSTGYLNPPQDYNYGEQYSSPLPLMPLTQCLSVCLSKASSGCSIKQALESSPTPGDPPSTTTTSMRSRWTPSCGPSRTRSSSTRLSVSSSFLSCSL